MTPLDIYVIFFYGSKMLLVLTKQMFVNDLPSILFVSVECATTPRFVELAHTLNHLQKLHCVVVDEAHLLLLDFRPIMKRMLPLWAMGC
jgi:superfamily II DNA helicase RecQ